ncbi:MAG: hemerythrin domain-containing protein, partial [Glaciimonas sp.]|nr:hemerythrin domain-containing protein [Glaciimonas sp.]
MMNQALFDAAPDFGQPIAVLKHCHERIRKQLVTLQKIPDYLQQHGADEKAKQAATSVLRYFQQAAPHHHADEEQDLFPMLIATAKDEDAEVLRKLGPEILRKHQQMDQLWQKLAAQLNMVESGSINHLSDADITHFSQLYSEHMLKEETWIAPMAKRIFNADQMAQLGAAMQRR